VTTTYHPIRSGYGKPTVLMLWSDNKIFNDRCRMPYLMSAVKWSDQKKDCDCKTNIHVRNRKVWARYRTQTKANQDQSYSTARLLTTSSPAIPWRCSLYFPPFAPTTYHWL
jgi:hypothetical protein